MWTLELTKASGPRGLFQIGTSFLLLALTHPPATRSNPPCDNSPTFPPLVILVIDSNVCWVDKMSQLSSRVHRRQTLGLEGGSRLLAVVIPLYLFVCLDTGFLCTIALTGWNSEIPCLCPSSAETEAVRCNTTARLSATLKAPPFWLNNYNPQN